MKMIRALLPTTIVCLVTVIVLGIFVTQSRVDEINLSHYELILMRTALEGIDQSLSAATINDEICIMASNAIEAQDSIKDEYFQSSERIEQMIADRERVWFRVLEQVEKTISENLIMAQHGK